jgi:hypothetical protein
LEEDCFRSYQSGTGNSHAGRRRQNQHQGNARQLQLALRLRSNAAPRLLGSGLNEQKKLAGGLDCCTFCCTDQKVHPPSRGKPGLTRGGANGTRTRNPLLAKQVRYQLRHGPSAVLSRCRITLPLRTKPASGVRPLMCVYRECTQAGGTVHSLLSDGTEWAAIHIAPLPNEGWLCTSRGLLPGRQRP